MFLCAFAASTEKTSFSVALLCCSVSFSLQKTPFEILIVFIFLYSLLVFICKAWMENDSFCQRALLRWSLLLSTLASPKIRQRRPEAVLRSSELSRTGDAPVLFPCSPTWSVVVILSAFLTFKPLVLIALAGRDPVARGDPCC